jgi:hypothetical protein
VIVRHPIGTVKAEEVNKRGDAAFGELLETLVEPPGLCPGGFRFLVSGFG